MTWFNYDIQAFFVQYLGRLFNKQKWHQWIYSLLYPLIQLWNTYDVWRKKLFYAININSQVIRLQGYLNDSWDTSLRRIYIGHFPGSYSGVYLALEQEGSPFLELPLVADGVEAPFIGLEADSQYAVSFIVYVPTALQYRENQIKSDIEKYKFTGKLYSIVYF